MMTETECKDIFNKCISNPHIMNTIFFKKNIDTKEDDFNEEVYMQKMLDNIENGGLKKMIDIIEFNIKDYYTERKVSIMLNIIPELFKRWVKQYSDYNFPVPLQYNDIMYYNKKDVNKWFKDNKMKKCKKIDEDWLCMEGILVKKRS